ncbi:Spindle and kinetochore-associated protein 1-like protein [Cucurbita argyrosperma subsp. argyrosperma]|nr:Spindle and kinetochore-associated protein 1-like protein [Cucurbita argyrosperma subsp. argyrosperma]
MDLKEAGSLLNNLVAAFNGRIAELQDLVIARNMYPASCIPDLSAVDASLKAMELQVQAIKNQLQEEAEAIPKAKKLIEASLKQQKRLESISLHVPSYHIQPERVSALNLNTSFCSQAKKTDTQLGSLEAENVISVLPKEKKGSSPPLWYITTDELNSLSSYMKGRLTVDKVNAAINDMATYAEANAQLIVVPKKKLAENQWEKALTAHKKLSNNLQHWHVSFCLCVKGTKAEELRDIATTEAVKGKYFFLETDMRGPSLKLDNTGKAILTVLRHLGRISETRIGHQRVILLLKPS